MSRRFLAILILKCLVLLVGCPYTLRAQSTPEKTRLEFSCVLWEPLPISEVFYRDGENYLPLEFSLGNRSRLYPLNQAGTLELYEKAEATDGGTTYRLLGKAPWIEGARRMLFLINAVPATTGLQVKMFGMNDALDVFPPGTFRFVNFSRAILQVKFGGQTQKLPPGEMNAIQSHVSEKGGFVPLLVGDSDGKVVFETRLFGQPTGREMVFIGPPAKSGGEPMVKFLTQIIPPEVPKPKG